VCVPLCKIVGAVQWPFVPARGGLSGICFYNSLQITVDDGVAQ
jgi:hypothetical protein